MTDFVLVHNGFAGGWVWKDVARKLRQAGHEAWAPTLTGLGERAHLARPEITLDTHVEDVLGLMVCEALSDVILVGSSSGVMVAEGVAERRPDLVRRLVHIDTPVPADGESWMDLLTPGIAAPLLEAARLYGDGWRVPRNDVLPPRWQPHPLGSVTQPLCLQSPQAAALPRSLVHCTARPEGWFFGLGEVIDRFVARAEAKGWDIHRLAADHLPQLGAPEALARILLVLD